MCPIQCILGCCYTYTPAVRVLSLWSSVIHEFCDRLPSCPVFMWARGLDCARAVRSLSSACIVLCWSVVFGSRHSCLEFRFRVGVRTLALHVLSLCGSVRSRVRSAACSSVLVCYVVFFYRLRAFMSCLVWTRGLWVFSLAACSCLVLHIAGDLFFGSCACVLFCVSTWLCLSFLCAMCSHVNLSWPHPSCYLIIG